MKDTCALIQYDWQYGKPEAPWYSYCGYRQLPDLYKIPFLKVYIFCRFLESTENISDKTVRLQNSFERVMQDQTRLMVQSDLKVVEWGSDAAQDKIHTGYRETGDD